MEKTENNAVKKNTVKEWIMIIIGCFVIGFLCSYIMGIRSNIAYFEDPCPRCGSDEVLILHCDFDSETCKCPDCGVEFRVNK